MLEKYEPAKKSTYVLKLFICCRLPLQLGHHLLTVAYVGFHLPPPFAVLVGFIIIMILEALIGTNASSGIGENEVNKTDHAWITLTMWLF